MGAAGPGSTHPSFGLQMSCFSNNQHTDHMTKKQNGFSTSNVCECAEDKLSASLTSPDI